MRFPPALLSCLVALHAIWPGVLAAEGSARPLFNGKDLEDWERLEFGGSGKVEVVDGKLVLGEGVELSGVLYNKPDELPTMNYEVEIEARRTSGFDFFCALTFPVGDLETCATFIVGGWGGGVVGISSIDGLDASENSTTGYMRFEDGEWHTIRLRVTPGRLQGWIGDREAFDEKIDGREIGLRPGQIDMCAPFGMATYQTTGEIRKVVVRTLEPPENPPAEPSPPLTSGQ